MKRIYFFLLLIPFILSACGPSASHDLQRIENFSVNPNIPSVTDAQVAPLGWVEGSVTYPAAGLPDDLEICARSLDTGQETCTRHFLKDSKYYLGVGYKIPLEPGQYRVEARRLGDSMKGLYTQFVPCGQTASCTDHTPLDVQVKINEVTDGIDPGDWYAN